MASLVLKKGLFPPVDEKSTQKQKQVELRVPLSSQRGTVRTSRKRVVVPEVRQVSF